MAKRVKITIDHALHEVVEDISDLKKLLLRANATALKATGNAVRTHSYRVIRDIGYADPKRYNVPAMRKKVSGTNNPTAWVKHNLKMAGPMADQNTTVFWSARSINLWYFHPLNKTYQTPAGKRYGVTVSIFGKRMDTGGFHVKGTKNSWRHGSPGGQGSFDMTSRVFRNLRTDKNDKGRIKTFRTMSPSQLLEQRGYLRQLEDWGYRYYKAELPKHSQRAINFMWNRKNKPRKKK